MLKLRTPKQIAIDIFNGDLKAKNELEKMMGKKLEDMTKEEKGLGLASLSAFESQWNL